MTAAVVALALVAAVPGQVTLLAVPTVAPPGGRVVLSGSVASGAAGEPVVVQAWDCGAAPGAFRAVAEVRTGEGGRWSLRYVPGIASTLRAVWREHASAPVVVRQRADVTLRVYPSGKVRVGVYAKRSFWGRRLLLQRFDRRLGRWVRVRSVVLTEQTSGTPQPGVGSWVWSWAELRPRLPAGTLLRAVLPAAAAGPCYLGGASRLARAR